MGEGSPPAGIRGASPQSRQRLRNWPRVWCQHRATHPLPFPVCPLITSINVALVPPFREAEVDSYFNAFERLAIKLKWPEEMWPLLLQCKIHSKAQEVVSAPPLADSVRSEAVKEAILRAYELVPEAYRQRFCSHKKLSTQTFLEFARDKAALFDRWCTASQVANFVELRELILIEEFNRSLPERVVIYLNEHEVSSLSAAANIAHEFKLIHKVAYQPPVPRSVRPR